MKSPFRGDREDILYDSFLSLFVSKAEFRGDVWGEGDLAVNDASERGEEKGLTLPILLDLARKPIFLNDASVKNLDELLNLSRGPVLRTPSLSRIR